MPQIEAEIQEVMKTGLMEYWGDGVLENGEKKQKSWLPATPSLARCHKLYVETCRLLRPFPFELKRIASQAIASADSVHRNIAEGYCRRSIREYIQHLYIALGSLGESVSGYHAYHKANQLLDEHFEILDVQAFKLENGLLRLVESLERKRDFGTWTESLIVSESNSIYTADNPDTKNPI